MENKKNIYILFLICFLQGLIFYYPIATLYRTSRGLTLFQISFIESASFVVTLLFEIPWGYLGDKWGLKRILIVSNGLYFISKYLFYIADGFYLFLLERIVLGFAIAGLSGCDSSLLYLSSGENHVKVFSWYSLCGTVGLLVASLLYSMLLVDNYTLAALLCSIVYFISFILTFGLDDLKEKNDGKESTTIDFKKLILNNKTIILFVVGSVLFSETIRELTLFLGQVRLSETGLLSSLFGIVTFLLTLVEFSTVFSDIYSKTIGYSKAISLSLILAMISSLLVGILDNPYSITFGLLFLSMNGALLSPIFEIIQQESVDTHYRASTISIYNVIGSSVAVILNMVYGYLGDINSRLAYYVATVVLLLSLLSVKIYFKKANKK